MTMVRKRGIGKVGMLLAAVVMAGMSVASFILQPSHMPGVDEGICLPSPNLWTINRVSSWLINMVLLGGVAIGSFFLNRTFNFIRSTQPVLPAMFLLLVGSCPWITFQLCSSTLICVVNLLSLSVLFNTFKSSNATQEMFTIGTLLSVGSMFQYAFLAMLPAYIVSAIVMKAFRIKEALALIMGLVAPYWVVLGLGLISPDAFRMPQFTNLFQEYIGSTELGVLVAAVGFAIFFGSLLGLNNGIKLYAGNSHVNAMNMSITLLGAVSIICIVVDFSNILAYLSTFYFTVAVQVANLCALWNIRHEWLVVAVPGVLYVGFFLAMVLV